MEAPFPWLRLDLEAGTSLLLGILGTIADGLLGSNKIL